MRIKHPLRLTFSTLCIIALSVGVVVSILKIINSEELFGNTRIKNGNYFS